MSSLVLSTCLLLLRMLCRLPGRWILFILIGAWNAIVVDCRRCAYCTLDNPNDFEINLKNVMLTSNVKTYASIECITQTKTHIRWYYIIWLCFRPFLPLCDLYHVNLTSEQLKIIIFQLGIPEYHNSDTKTTKLTRIQPYLYYQWPFWIYAN